MSKSSWVMFFSETLVIREKGWVIPKEQHWSCVRWDVGLYRPNVVAMVRWNQITIDYQQLVQLYSNEPVG